MNYTVTRREQQLQVHDRSSSYTLYLATTTVPPIVRVFFNVPKRERVTRVVARTIDEYPAFPIRSFAERYQVVEVCAGLGGFIPCVLAKQSPLSPPPIVIDPVSYDAIHDLLAYAKVREFDELPDTTRSTLDVLLARAQLYLDPRKVRHVQLSLGAALRKERSLQGIADLVVDNRRHPDEHAAPAAKSRVSELGKLLLNKDGLLLTN